MLQTVTAERLPLIIEPRMAAKPSVVAEAEALKTWQSTNRRNSGSSEVSKVDDTCATHSHRALERGKIKKEDRSS
jgi:hypothetical protein